MERNITPDTQILRNEAPGSLDELAAKNAKIAKLEKEKEVLLKIIDELEAERSYLKKEKEDKINFIYTLESGYKNFMKEMNNIFKHQHQGATCKYGYSGNIQTLHSGDIRP